MLQPKFCVLQPSLRVSIIGWGGQYLLWNFPYFFYFFNPSLKWKPSKIKNKKVWDFPYFSGVGGTVKLAMENV